jgi:hemoglobin
MSAAEMETDMATADILRAMASEEDLDRRSRIAAEIRERTGIDEQVIASLVSTFYARIQLHPVLGPIFKAKIEDWDHHIEKLTEFWSSVVLMSGRYHGQPMRAHLPLNIDARHFDQWLALFRRTAHDVCPPPAAAYFIERAERIAESLELGVATFHGCMLTRGERFHRADLAPTDLKENFESTPWPLTNSATDRP